MFYQSCYIISHFMIWISHYNSHLGPLVAAPVAVVGVLIPVKEAWLLKPLTRSTVNTAVSKIKSCLYQFLAKAHPSSISVCKMRPHLSSSFVLGHITLKLPLAGLTQYISLTVTYWRTNTGTKTGTCRLRCPDLVLSICDLYYVVYPFSFALFYAEYFYFVSTCIFLPCKIMNMKELWLKLY